MSSETTLEELYTEVVGDDPDSVTVFVAPPIRFAYKKSDYLYLFYKDLFKNDRYKIESLSGWKHIKLAFSSLRKRPSILHYHWIECTGVFRIPSFLCRLFCIWIFLKRGGNLIWSIHNKMPADGRNLRFNFLARRWLAGTSSLLHVECHSVIPELSRYFGVSESKFRVIPHPDYPHSLYPRAAAVEAINLRYDAHLKMQDKLFLMIGHISPYKRIGTICRIFSELPPQKKLIIIGPVKRGQMKYYKRLRRLIRNSGNILLIPQFIDEENVPEFLNACDYILFNYDSTFVSGGVFLAKSYRKQIILPDTPCMREFEDENMHFFNTKAELKQLLQEA
ncbi:MAG: glycosyltransferase [Balneolaceae bacterium]|nr:glycosyltransferase [Balneolaceae bacterium]